ncbi:protein phosphatase [Gammaproteobacteria bacterium 45_16_T64]|nr:protein phosphatase [Gammaproteobacteria bacterium 45_16_T64]
MSQLDKAGDDTSLVKHAKELLSQLETGNSLDAMKTIESLKQQRDQYLFDEVGKLTRSLHSAIRSFAIDAELGDQDSTEMSRMADASDRLNYVIERTEQAANKTMDVVEEVMPSAQEISSGAQELKEDWDRFMRKEMKPDEFRQLTKRVDGFLTTTVEKSSSMGGQLSEILLAQDYQDLTGQVIKRVISLVEEVEDSLVGLVKMAGELDHLTGSDEELEALMGKESATTDDGIGAEGPIINPEERADVVSGQDEVDDLLSSLGF